MRRQVELSATMTEAEFDNGYWYATQLRDFAVRLGIPSAKKMRKDELERAVKHFLRTGEPQSFIERDLVPVGVRDVDKGLSLDLPIVNYTSNRQTKDFIDREATRIEPGFKRAPGTRYLLNRWRESQLAAGKTITYRDLVLKAIELSKTKQGPLRLEHGRYMNFISDFMAANKTASRADAVAAWHEVKEMDTPKTYASWAKAHNRN